MACKDCFNGCVDIQPDKCVKYTGPDVEDLGINSGDSYYVIQQNIINHLLEALDGTGIVFNITDACALVDDKLPSTGDITIINYVQALTDAVCELQEMINTNISAIEKIEATYTIGCLEGVSPGDGTHDILQATINLACLNKSAIEALALDIETNYAKIADLPQYFADLVLTEDVLLGIKAKMVPYTVVEYYGSLGVFDASGAGTGEWERVFLCNGNNGTPDKRGRMAVGTIVGVGGGALAPEVDPVNPGNPNYSLLSATGENSVSLSVNQLPSHSHDATFSSDPHNHQIDPPVPSPATGFKQALSLADNIDQVNVTETSSETVTGTVTIENTGGGDKHPNIPPVLSCYYIMYIPAP